MTETTDANGEYLEWERDQDLLEITQVQCSFADCRNESTGACTDCQKLFCVDHLHYAGPHPDKSGLVLFCPEDLEKRKRPIFQPIPINLMSHDDIEKVRNIVIDYIEARTNPSLRVSDLKQRIFESAVEMVYGNQIWPRLRR